MQNLTRQDAKQLCNDFIHSKYSDADMAEILVSLSDKKETSEELSGFVDALLENAEPFPSRTPAFDVCGTGGSSGDRFNVSTAVAFILASLGIKVAKHGNRGSRKANGSFDLLEMLEIPIDLGGEKLSELLEKTNLAFVFARRFHPAMRNVALARQIAGRRTIFNWAGPLSNPAHIQNQIIGTIDKSFFNTILATCNILGRNKFLVVSGHPDIDELSITGSSTYKTSWENFPVELSPEQIGITKCDSSKIPCGDAKENATEFLKLITGNGNKFLEDMVCANAGLALYCQNNSISISDGITQSREAIHTGLVNHKFIEYKKMAMKN